MKMKRKNMTERFWKKVDKSGNCWEWMAYKLYNGYGRFGIDGKIYYAHRVAYELEIGKIPDEMLVCHHCDNPGCVNPEHLFIGTQLDNVLNAKKKGRLSNTYDKHGKSNPNSKITEEEVHWIRMWALLGYSNPEIAKPFNISRSAVSHIKTGYTWDSV